MTDWLWNILVASVSDPGCYGNPGSMFVMQLGVYVTPQVLSAGLRWSLVDAMNTKGKSRLITTIWLEFIITIGLRLWVVSQKDFQWLLLLPYYHIYAIAWCWVTLQPAVEWEQNLLNFRRCQVSMFTI